MVLTDTIFYYHLFTRKVVRKEETEEFDWLRKHVYINMGASNVNKNKQNFASDIQIFLISSKTKKPKRLENSQLLRKT